ncbi:sigma-70 family RNA polymerase sigma factor [Actinomadura kijaniata]|uniref:RNA polymerase sigma-70 factor (ECF subfamily) n=1 Tax=Actinomadura namibiensis TaxID=182080 RepID=A0A7W3LNS9_ACTNM|nr:sigma-70 family RNA polymerase sigma factor [Actinomadura namibiensis]MBA8951561.1 RNA polymerase sigma-70 factor (ECF subfamily) [Actinomadura namibiensis]
MSPDPLAHRFEHAYRAHSAAVLGYLVRRAEPPEDAADLMAEVFTVAWRRVADMPPGDEARLWLYGVARNVLSNHRRSRIRRHRLADRLREHLSRSPRVHHDDARHDEADHVRAALATLPERDREVIALTAWEGMTAAEIAVVLDLDPGTVRSRLSRARARLRAALADQDRIPC